MQQIAFSTLLTFATLAAGADQSPKLIPKAVEAKDEPAAKLPDLPKGIEVKVGSLATFSVKGKDVGYTPTFDKSKCLLMRLYSDTPDVMEFAVQPLESGEFAIVFWLVGEKRGGVVTIKTPSNPVPPPTPPGPPLPTNQYREKLKAAFDGDSGDTATKDDTRKDLAELYRQAYKLARDKSILDVKQLRDKLRETSQRLAADALIDTRHAIAEIIAGIVPADAKLDDATRAKAEAIFSAIAEALSW